VKKGYQFPCSSVHNDKQAQAGNGGKYPFVPGPNWPSSSQRDSPLMLVGTHSRRTTIPAPEFARHQNKFQHAGMQTYATHFTPRTSAPFRGKSSHFQTFLTILPLVVFRHPRQDIWTIS